MVTIDAKEVGFLAGILAYPGEDSLKTLEELVPDAPWLQAVMAELHSMPLDAWQGEHTRLFISGIPKTICPPFESAWRSDIMQGAGIFRIREMYRQAGLEPATEEMDVPDYLGTMLECVAYLATTTAVPQEKRSGLLDDIWNNHLTTWVPDFAKTLIRESQVELYRTLGRRLQALFERSTHS